MPAAIPITQSATNPLSGLVLRDVLEPRPTPGWSRGRVAASSLNLNGLWTLRGVGRPRSTSRLSLGRDDGGEVIDRRSIGDSDARGDETLDPNPVLLSEQHDGAFVEHLTVSTRICEVIPAWIARFMTTAKGQ
ncbi:hypothetical protein [Streptomyces umbrinus]|uniref:hypothetical protein n=1 Tax=Streptomyces umbrinus TaxID=67370 RepID=UPI0033FC3F13